MSTTGTRRLRGAGFALTGLVFLVSTRYGPFSALGTFGLRGFRLLSYVLFPSLFALVWFASDSPSLGAETANDTQTVPPSLGRGSHVALLLAAALTSFCLYASTLKPYIHDDYDMDNFVRTALRRTVGSIFVPGAAYYFHGVFRPLHTLSYVVDYWTWDDWRTGPHITNLVVYGIVVYLVGLLGWRLTQRRSVALIGAALFGLHAAHPEVATWRMARYESLCTAWYVGSLLALLSFFTSRRKGWLVLSLVCFGAAFLSKELAGSLPLAVAALALFQEGSLVHRVRRAVLLAFPYVTMLLGFFLYQYVVQRALVVAQTGIQRKFVLLSLVSSSWWYLFYPFQEFLIRNIPLRIALSALLTLPLLVVFHANHRPPMATVFVLLLVSMLPISLVMEPSPWLGDARQVYLPSVFLAIGLAMAFDRAYDSARGLARVFVPVSLAGLTLAYTILAVINTSAWNESGAVAYALPRQARALPSLRGTTGPIYVWGAIRPEVNPVGATLAKSFMADYWGFGTLQVRNPENRHLWLAWITPDGGIARRPATTLWSDSQARWFEGSIDGRLPDLTRVARQQSARFLLWSPYSREVFDRTAEIRHRVEGRCPGAEATTVTSLSTGPVSLLTWGTPAWLISRRVTWVPSWCDHITLRLRIRPPAAPHPYGNRMTVVWQGTGTPASDPILMRLDFAPMADGIAHSYDFPIGRHPRWLLLDRVSRFAVDVPTYPARVELIDAQLMRSATERPAAPR